MNPSERSLHIVHTESSCGWGGQEIRILEESRGMMALGHNVTIICPAESRLYQRAGEWGVLAIAQPIRKKRLFALLALRNWLKNAVKPDIINTHSSTDSWLVAVALRTLGENIPVVRTRHISAPVKTSASNRWLYGRAAKFVVTTGEKLRQDLISGLRLQPDVIRSIPTGIDTELFVPGDKQTTRQALGLQEDLQWIGIVATLRSWKGHLYLLEAFKQLDDPKLGLLIVGDGPQREALKRKVDELDLTSRVHFVGNQKKVVPWLQSMDIFVLPSYANEGVSQAVMQAMSCGLPIITTAVGSMTDVIHDKETGLLVTPRDAAELAQALRQLLNDEPFARTLGNNARKFAVEHCGLEHMVEQMEGIFKCCLNGNKQGAKA